MGSSSTNVHFDYDEHYSKSEDDYEWILTDGRLYDISFKTSSMEEITYLFLKERICKKINIEPCSYRLNLSYIPLVVEPKRQSYILDDEDVFVYLTSVDKEQRRSILHVELIKELEIVPITEQQSQSRGIERVENVVNGKEDDGGTGLDNMSVDNEKNMDNSMGIGAICEYVELPPVAKEIPVVIEWEDSMGIEMFQEFQSKEAVKDLIDRASQQKQFLNLYLELG
ncbi:hypothetical protein N665_0098s0032 [Sinapis alba]|nr:hypothetical protein N665_0098s0032 [Sinapis alba]